MPHSLKFTSLPKHLRTFLWRIGFFVALFVIVTGIIGPWVIGTRLLYGFDFYIYGNLGKLVLFSLFVFILLTKDTIKGINIQSYDKKYLIFILVAFLVIPLFFYMANILLGYKHPNDNRLLWAATHTILVSIPLLLILGVFGWSFLVSFSKRYRKQLLICLILSLFFFFLIFQVWKLWPFFSQLVLQTQHALFGAMFSPVYIIPPRGLFVKNFAVEIGEACSGIESIFLFSVLYCMIVLLEWKQINHAKAAGLFPVLLLLLIGTNILRVFLLILIGVLVNPQIMAALFHTYLGMILFIVFFLLFLRIGYPWLKK